MGFVSVGIGPPGPQGDPGTPGPPGEFAPIEPDFTPNSYTAKYRFRVAAGKSYVVTMQCELARIENPTKRIAWFYRALTIKDDGTGNVALPFSLVEVAPDQKETGPGGMSTASISQAIAPGDPASAEITVTGPTGSTIRFAMSILTSDGVDLV